MKRDGKENKTKMNNHMWCARDSCYLGVFTLTGLKK